MFGRGAIEKQLREKQQLLEQREAEAARDTAIAEADDEQRELARLELDGKVSADQVAARLDGLAEKQRRHRLSAAHARQVADGLRAEIVGLQQRLAEEPFDEALQKVAAAGAELVKASDVLAKSLPSSIAAARRLAKKRADLAEAVVAAKEARPEWRDDEIEIPDEVAWPAGVDELAEILTTGPRRPGEAEEARVAKQAKADAQAEARRVPAVVAAIVGRRSLLAEELTAAFLALSDGERASALRNAEVELPKIEDEIRDRFRAADSLFPPNSPEADRAAEKVRTAIRARIDRLGDLAAAKV